ncbi:MAG TPA: hypothetical protein VH637_22775 [Streptosporangiaceae bacterium]
MTMIRRAIRATSVLLSTLAIPAAVLVAPLPVSAASGESICESFGNSYCLNSANFNSFTPIFEDNFNNARTIDFDGNLLVLHGSANQSQCVAATNNDDNVVVKPCSGSIGVGWTLKIVDGSDEWINNAATRNAGRNIFLAGRNCRGCQFALLPSGVSGALYKFFING